MNYSGMKGVAMQIKLMKTYLASSLRYEKWKEDRGASAVEYGLLVALIAIVIIASVTLLGGNLTAIFNKAASSISK